MSGRIGALKTAGSGCVEPLGFPSLEAMVTVGRVVIVSGVIDQIVNTLVNTIVVVLFDKAIL